MSNIIILSIVLIFSLLVNAVMFWYLRQLTSKLSFIYTNIGDVSEVIANYRAHLTSVYSMEMFYGDQTLKFLLEHTNSIKEILEEYEDPEFFIEQFEEETEIAQQQEEEKYAKTSENKENVFYAGSRRRDN